MAYNLYWVSALVYAIVLTIFLVNDIRLKKMVIGAERDCRIMFFWVILFCLQDMVWGLCENHIIKGDLIFFISSAVFHLSTVITTFFWLKYILSFLGDKIKHKKIYLVLDGLVVLFEFILVIINFYRPMIFRVANGVYYTEKYRIVTFFNQYIVYLLIGISTLILAIKERTDNKQRYYTVFYYSLAPIIAGALQLLYPDAPFYSTGYFLGCIIVHVFILAKDRTLYARSELIKSIADIYYSMHIIEIEKKSIEPYVEPPEILKIKGKESGVQQRLNYAVKTIASAPYVQMVTGFVDLSTVSVRMKNRNSISVEFIGKGFGWIRISFISIACENGKQKRVMLTTQIIDRERREQIDLEYKSRSDELTQVYNRRAYENLIDKLDKKALADDLLYISMDVNGLKTINDTRGHSAGDELLIGAAQCINDTFAMYGDVFRIGGDEFISILNVSKEKYDELTKRFEKKLNEWSANNDTNMNISYGAVWAVDYPGVSIREIAKIADKKMYKDKAEYYSKNGLNRREQREFNTNLMELYDAFIKVNLEDGIYSVINNTNTNFDKIQTDIFEKYISNLIDNKYIYADDKAIAESKLNIEFMKTFFSSSNKLLKFGIRIKKDDVYRQYLVEIITSNEYNNGKHIILICFLDIE